MFFFHSSNPCDCKLTVYAEANYEGRSLVVKEQNADFYNDNFNHMYPESLKITGKCHWLLYTSSNFEGSSFIVQPSKPYPTPYEWGHSDVSINSARALPPRGTRAIAIFANTQFNHQMVVIKKSNPDLASLGFPAYSDSSYIVTGGKWTLYEYDNYQGRNVTTSRSFKVVSEATIGSIGSVKRL